MKRQHQGMARQVIVVVAHRKRQKSIGDHCSGGVCRSTPKDAWASRVLVIRYYRPGVGTTATPESWSQFRSSGPFSKLRCNVKFVSLVLNQAPTYKTVNFILSRSMPLIVVVKTPGLAIWQVRFDPRAIRRSVNP